MIILMLMDSSSSLFPNHTPRVLQLPCIISTPVCFSTPNRRWSYKMLFRGFQPNKVENHIWQLSTSGFMWIRSKHLLNCCQPISEADFRQSLQMRWNQYSRIMNSSIIKEFTEYFSNGQILLNFKTNFEVKMTNIWSSTVAGKYNHLPKE